MNADFLDAHYRHWQDAEYLREAARWANADHLYGMAAECGLKHLMKKMFNMTTDTNTGSPSLPVDRVHINEASPKKDSAWVRYSSYLSGSNGHAPEYALSTINPFQDWDVAQRYAARTHFDASRVQAHQQGAEQVRQLIRRSQRNEGQPV